MERERGGVVDWEAGRRCGETDLPGVGVTAITCFAAFLRVIAGILAPFSFVFTALGTVVVPVTLHRRLFTCFGK